MIDVQNICWIQAPAGCEFARGKPKVSPTVCRQFCVNDIVDVSRARLGNEIWCPAGKHSYRKTGEVVEANLRVKCHRIQPLKFLYEIKSNTHVGNSVSPYS